MVYSKQIKAQTSFCGANCNLSPIGFMQIVQDEICEYFETLGVGQISVKNEHNSIWVFIQNKIKIFENIFWNEDMSVKCFISFRSQAKLIVDTHFCALDGKTKAYAKTEICLVDLSSFRLRRISGEILPNNFQVQNSMFDFGFEKFVDRDLPFITSTKVESTHIDFCGHCNNVEYLRILLNTYSALELKEFDVCGIEVAYISQALEGETLDIYKKIEGKEHFFEIKRQGKDVLKCKIDIR